MRVAELLITRNNWYAIEIFYIHPFSFSNSWMLFNFWLSADHLMVSRPLILSYALPESVEKSIPRLRDVFNHSCSKNVSQTLTTNLTAVQSDFVLRQFSKSHKYHRGVFPFSVDSFTPLCFCKIGHI